ncbi:MAG TPA: hypothetical protein VGG35_14300 [Streptosporangiaceae bacterium]|jgi:hypothetical protein
MRSSKTMRLGGLAGLVLGIGALLAPAAAQASSAVPPPTYRPGDQAASTNVAGARIMAPAVLSGGTMSGGTMAGGAMAPAAAPSLTRQLATARLATAKYATSLSRAKADGYRIITKMMPNMGFHFMNAKIQGFHIRKPQILVYEHTSPKTWQLGALEWVFPKMPASPPLPNATFGSFPAACHYADGTFIPDQHASTCAKKAPGSGAKFTFWHPDLVTMHVWVWYPNPAGLFSSTNPLVAPFNNG